MSPLEVLQWIGIVFVAGLALVFLFVLFGAALKVRNSEESTKKVSATDQWD